MPTLKFVFGQVLSFDALPPNSIALDGAVQGPHIDAANRRFSFDHHAGCTRLVTLATCQQVAEALYLGLVVDEATEIYANDWDADTALSLWLLENPHRVQEPEVQELVRRVGLTDAHGPIHPPHPIHWELSLPYGDKTPQTGEMWAERFRPILDALFSGEWAAKPPRPQQRSKGWGWAPAKGWYEVVSDDGFASVYAGGALAAMLYTEAQPTAEGEATYVYTVAKRSDLVPLAVGPGTTKRPAESENDYLGTILGQLGLAELRHNPNQSHAANWGGASSVGGGPRNPSAVGSVLPPGEVLSILESFSSK